MQEQEDVESQRRDSHLLGQGLELSYVDKSSKFNVRRLAKAAIDQCGPIFYKENWYIGIGVGAESVFVGMMEESAFWVNDPSALPPGVNNVQYTSSLEERFYMAVRKWYFYDSSGKTYN